MFDRICASSSRENIDTGKFLVGLDSFNEQPDHGTKLSLTPIRCTSSPNREDGGSSRADDPSRSRTLVCYVPSVCRQAEQLKHCPSYWILFPITIVMVPIAIHEVLMHPHSQPSDPHRCPPPLRHYPPANHTQKADPRCHPRATRPPPGHLPPQQLQRHITSFLHQPARQPRRRIQRWRLPQGPRKQGQARWEPDVRSGRHGRDDGDDEGEHGYDDPPDGDHGMDQCVLCGLRDQCVAVPVIVSSLARLGDEISHPDSTCKARTNSPSLTF